MKKLIFALLLGLTSLGLCNADLAGYTIKGYNANYELTEDGILKVTEDIDVNFSEYRHGIYRKIPYVYSNYLKTPIKKVKVPGYKFSEGVEGNNFVIKIGDPNRTIIGNHKYSIQYNIKGTVREFSGYQELYRNVLGTEWATPVNNYKFSLTLPTDVDISNEDIRVYEGLYGSKNTIKARKRGNVISLDGTLDLGAYHGVTLAVKLPANYVPTKEYYSIRGWFSYHKKTFTAGIWSIVLCIIGFYTVRVGRKVNKNWINFKKKKQKLTQTHWRKIRDVIHFSLPEGYTAAEIAAIYNRKSTFDSLSAFLFSRIQDGYVRLEPVSQKKRFFKSKTYEFKVNTTNPKFKFDESRGDGGYLHFLKPEEKFWDLCFVSWDINNLDSFKEVQSEILKKISDEIFYSVHSKLIPQYGELHAISYSLCDKYKAPSRKLTRKEFTKTQSNFFCLISMLLCGIATLFLIVKSNLDVDYSDIILPFFFIFAFASVLLNVTISGIVKTIIMRHDKSGFKNIGEDEKYIIEDGIDVVEQTFGFRKYLLKVDDKKLRTLLSQDPTYFEKILPYAIALGVGNHWIKKCMKYLSKIKDVSEIKDIGYTDRYDAISSKTDFSRSISDRVHTIDHPHNTGGGGGGGGGSSRSSGSSGSSGGGWSGGGGGGGGGGSW